MSIVPVFIANPEDSKYTLTLEVVRTFDAGFDTGTESKTIGVLRPGDGGFASFNPDNFERLHVSMSRVATLEVPNVQANPADNSG